MAEVMVLRWTVSLWCDRAEAGRGSQGRLVWAKKEDIEKNNRSCVNGKGFIFLLEVFSATNYIRNQWTTLGLCDG